MKFELLDEQFKSEKFNQSIGFKWKVVVYIGLKPTFCGKGYGKDIMKLLIKESKKRYPQYPVTLEVRSFNKRAIKCYLDVGFEIKDKYIKDTFDGKDEFYYMEYFWET